MVNFTKPPKNILVINTHGIGDVIMGASSLLSLQETYDSSNIQIVVKSKVEADVLHSLGINAEFLFLQRAKSGVLELIAKTIDFRKRSFDMIICMPGTNPVLGPLLALWSGAKIRIGVDEGILSFMYNIQSKIDNSQHKVIQCHKLLENIYVKETVQKLHFNFDDSIERHVNDFLGIDSTSKPIIVGIAPGSGEKETHKRLPIQDYVWISKRLLEKYPDLIFIICGSKSEMGMCEDLTKAIQGTLVINTAGIMSIIETAALIDKTDVMMGSDNGLMHIAAATQTPNVTCFGPTNPQITGPYSNLSKKISTTIGCAPCYSRTFYQGCGNPICMSMIPKANMLSELTNLIAKV